MPDSYTTQGNNWAMHHGQLVIVKAFIADCTEVETRQGGALNGLKAHGCVSLEKNGNPKHKQVSLSNVSI